MMKLTPCFRILLLQHDGQDCCGAAPEGVSDANELKVLRPPLLVPVEGLCQQVLFLHLLVDIGRCVNHALRDKHLIKKAVLLLKVEILNSNIMAGIFYLFMLRWRTSEAV